MRFGLARRQKGGNAMMFTGIYAKAITDYIEFKRSMGYKMRDVEYVFLQFDRMTVEMGIDKIGLTKELSDAWCCRKPNESQGTQYIRAKYISLFSRYLNGLGYDSYIPNVPKLRYSFSAYVFTKEEIIALFNACDKYAELHLKRSRYHFIPTLIRLLYCTGMRLQEALSIRKSDLDLNDLTITVRNTKNGDDRIIPFSYSLLPYLKELMLQHVEPKTDILFQLDYKYNTSKSWIVFHFRAILDVAGIVYKGKQIGPRIHDLRHTFACHSLKKMDESGMDIYTGLPILSTYLGHKSMDGTEKYTKLTSEIYPDIIKKAEDLRSDLYPTLNMNDYETN